VVIASGIASLWGPAHGGANEAVIKMLTEINALGKPLSSFIERAKDKKGRFRLMGFGHRVYKNHDPRAKIIREICYKMLIQDKCQKPEYQKLLDTTMADPQSKIGRPRQLYTGAATRDYVGIKKRS